MCTHNSVQPELVKKGPWGTHQCLNPNIRSESFLLLSSFNQIFQVFHESTQKLKYFTSISLITCWGGVLDTQNIFVQINHKKFSLDSPHKRLKKHILIKCFSKTTYVYAIFEGEKGYMIKIWWKKKYFGWARLSVSPMNWRNFKMLVNRNDLYKNG